jgi:hypothetical protein
MMRAAPRAATVQHACSYRVAHSLPTHKQAARLHACCTLAPCDRQLAAGLWCFACPTESLHISVLDDSAAALDACKCSGPVFSSLEALERIHGLLCGLGFPAAPRVLSRAAVCLESSHGIPRLRILRPLRRITEIKQPDWHQQPSVAWTVGRLPEGFSRALYPLLSLCRPYWRGRGWAPDPHLRGGRTLGSANRGGYPKKCDFGRRFYLSRASFGPDFQNRNWIFWRNNSEKIGFSRCQARKNIGRPE